MKQALLLSAILLTTPLSARKVKGLDLSDPVDNFQCLKDAGYSFVIPRGYQSKEGNWWPSVQNIRNARAAGMEFVDVYFFPCREWNVRDQLNSMVNYL